MKLKIFIFSALIFCSCSENGKAKKDSKVLEQEKPEEKTVEEDVFEFSIKEISKSEDGEEPHIYVKFEGDLWNHYEWFYKTHQSYNYLNDYLQNKKSNKVLLYLKKDYSFWESPDGMYAFDIHPIRIEDANSNVKNVKKVIDLQITHLSKESMGRIYFEGKSYYENGKKYFGYFNDCEAGYDLIGDLREYMKERKTYPLTYRLYVNRDNLVNYNGEYEVNLPFRVEDLSEYY